MSRQHLLLVVTTSLLVAAVLLIWAFSDRWQAGADTPHYGLDFSIGIDANGDTTDDCATSGGPTKCFVLTSKFALKVYLNSLGIPSYDAFDLLVTYAGSVASQDNPSASAWPDCALPLARIAPGELLWGCTIGVGAPSSTYTGQIGSTGFVCPTGQSGSVSLEHGLGKTWLVDDSTGKHAEGANTAETLTINCGPQPLETVSAVIGPAGNEGNPLTTGTKDSVEASLSIPAGALSENTTITIAVYDSDDVGVPRPPGDGPLFSRAFLFGPVGLDLTPAGAASVNPDPPVITFTYDDAEIAGFREEDLDIALLDPDTEQWELAQVKKHDMTKNTLTVAVERLTHRQISDDFDGDSCASRAEEQTAPGSEASGGRRDWQLEWDYFNPTQDGRNRSDDISAVVQKYGHDQGVYEDYDVRYDRTELVGGNLWQFDAPDGLIRSFELTASVRSYGHDCAPPTPTPTPTPP